MRRISPPKIGTKCGSVKSEITGIAKSVGENQSHGTHDFSVSWNGPRSLANERDFPDERHGSYLG